MAQSKAGTFDPSIREMAQQQAADLGVSKGAFGSALQRYGVESPAPTTATPTTPTTSSPEGATQNVMFQKEFGSGLAAQKAMQNPNYQLGSGSSLRQPARRIGTLSGDLNRASRRLRRQGYKDEAATMASQAEMQRLTEPSITTQADREMGVAMNIQQGKMALEDEAYKRRMMGLTEQLLRKRLEEPA